MDWEIGIGFGEEYWFCLGLVDGEVLITIWIKQTEDSTDDN